MHGARSKIPGKNSSPYIYVKFLALLGAPYIYDISRLRVNRTQSSVAIGLVTGHNTLITHLHLMGLINSPLRRKCGAKYENSAHIFCECEALASLRPVYLGSPFLYLEYI
jgi:hypothetical protein